MGFLSFCILGKYSCLFLDLYFRKIEKRLNTNNSVWEVLVMSTNWQPDNLILTRDWFLCGLGQPISDGESDYVRRMILRKRFSLLPRVFAFPLFYFFSFVPLLRSLFLLCLFWAFFSFLSRYLAIRSLSPPFPILKILFSLSLLPLPFFSFSLPSYSQCCFSHLFSLLSLSF